MAYYQESYRIQKDLASTKAQAYLPDLATSRLGNLHLNEMQTYEHSIPIFQEYVQVNEEMLKRKLPVDWKLLTTALNLLGLLFHTLKKDYPTSEQYYQQLLSIRQELATTQPEGYNEDLAATHLALSKLYQEDGYQQKEASLSHAQQAIELLSALQGCRPQSPRTLSAGTRDFGILGGEGRRVILSLGVFEIYTPHYFKFLKFNSK